MSESVESSGESMSSDSPAEVGEVGEVEVPPGGLVDPVGPRRIRIRFSAKNS